MSDFPEHDKLAKHRAEHQAINDFVAWLDGHDEYNIVRRDGATMTERQLGRMIAEYFDIDFTAFEAEKEKAYADLRVAMERPHEQA